MSRNKNKLQDDGPSICVHLCVFIQVHIKMSGRAYKQGVRRKKGWDFHSTSFQYAGRTRGCKTVKHFLLCIQLTNTKYLLQVRHCSRYQEYNSEDVSAFTGVHARERISLDTNPQPLAHRCVYIMPGRGKYYEGK